MPTISEIQLLVKNIAALSNSLPRSVPNGTTKDKIWAVMHTQDGETMFETFNKRLDALFGEDCRDSDGRLYHIRQGKNGMGLVCAYLNQIKWTSDIPLDLVKIKLVRLCAELAHLRCVSASIFIMIVAKKLSGAMTRMSLLSPLDHPAKLIHHRSLQMLTTPNSHNFHFSEKQLKLFVHARSLMHNPNLKLHTLRVLSNRLHLPPLCRNPPAHPL